MHDETAAVMTDVHPVTDPHAEDCADALDEATAFIGAALCTGSVPLQLRPPLHALQDDLLDLADYLLTPAAHLPGRVPAVDRIARFAAAHRSEEPPRDFAVLGGSVIAVGLLRVARAVTRRARRAAQRFAAGSEFGDAVVRYLDTVAELLVVLAFETELRENRDLPIAGLCGGTVPFLGPHVVRRRSAT